MRFLFISLLLPALLVVTSVLEHGDSRAQTDDLLALTSAITYDVKSRDDAVHVTWDATVTNNDPESTFRNGQGFYYYAYQLPILNGASNISVVDNSGRQLDAELREASSSAIVQSATINFYRGIFFGESYSFRLTYDLTDSHTRSAFVTPYYGYVAIVGAGDPATINVNLPAGEEWATSLEGEACQKDGSTLVCTGLDGSFVAAVAEASQPGRTSSLNFEVPLSEKTLNVSLKYFEGDEATAQRQQNLIVSALPVIEDTFGFNHPGPTQLNVSQGGQQTVLGYEGLARCDEAACNIVISPTASDHTLIHELSHIWTDIYSKRWLAEGFAEMIAGIVARTLPEDVVQGAAPERQASSLDFQLDDWGPATSLIGADTNRIAIEDAGYDYSLRFLEQLRTAVGIQALRAVNRNIATSGSPADSRRFMDLLEDASGRNSDYLFQVWVFPESYRQILADRREARVRLADLRSDLSAEGLPSDVLTSIEIHIADWSFAEALISLDRAETGLDTYSSLLPQLEALREEAQEAGLELPEELFSDLAQFEFDSVSSDVIEADAALEAYRVAAEKVHSSRSLWTRFGLLGSNPNATLDDAAESFANGDFGASRIQSEHSADLIDDASSMAFRRLLLVAGLLAALALAMAVAIAVGHLREREFAER
jgi:hypothetical protein